MFRKNFVLQSRKKISTLLKILFGRKKKKNRFSTYSRVLVKFIKLNLATLRERRSRYTLKKLCPIVRKFSLKLTRTLTFRSVTATAALLRLRTAITAPALVPNNTTPPLGSRCKLVFQDGPTDVIVKIRNNVQKIQNIFSVIIICFNDREQNNSTDKNSTYPRPSPLPEKCTEMRGRDRLTRG